MILNDLIQQSVKVGNVFVPAISVESVLGKHCVHLFVWAHDEVYKLRLVGSAIPIKFKGRFFLICARHQLREIDPKDVCLLYPDGSIAVTCSGVRLFNDTTLYTETDAYDLVALEFSEPCDEHPILKEVFYNFSAVPPNVTSDNVIGLIAVGYPSEDQLYELDEKNHIGSTRRILTASLKKQPSDHALLQAEFVQPLDFNPDGLSGGPVFVIQSTDNTLTAYLGGVILRAGRNDMRFLKSGYIQSFLNSFIVD